MKYSRINPIIVLLLLLECTIYSAAKAQSLVSLADSRSYYNTDDDLYVRVREDGTVFIGNIDPASDMDATNAEFKRVAGLGDRNLVSFESSKFPGKYLRHKNGKIILQSRPWFSPAFDSSATFKPIPYGIRGNNYAYESLRKKNFFIQMSGDELIIDRADPNYDIYVDDSYILVEKPGPVNLNAFHWGSASASYRQYDQGIYRVVEYDFQCTGLIPWWGGPAPRVTGEWQLSYPGSLGSRTRRIRSTAVGTKAYGFFPWIKFYVVKETLLHPSSMQGYVAKIERGSFICLW